MIKHKGNIQIALNEFKNDKNNAVAFVYENPSFGDGPLNGATISIKDNYATIDAPTVASSKILEGFKPSYDAEVIVKLRKSGAAFIGKTHLDELALGGTGTFSAFGVTSNPLDQTRLVGGSSSGAAATLTESISIALGSDTGDSVRLPASYIGKVGFKPSYGAISRYGLYSFASSLDTVAYFAHNVDDIILTSKVLFGQDKKDMTSKNVSINPTEEKPRKIGYLNKMNILDEQSRKSFEKLLADLTNEGIEVVPVDIDDKILKLIDITYMVISFSEASSDLARLSGINYGNRVDGSDWSEIMTNTRSNGFGKMVQRRLALGSFFLSNDNIHEIFEQAQKVRRILVDTFNNVYSQVDFLIFPAAAPAPKIEIGKASNWHSSYLTHSNFEGSPSLVIPFTKSENMPVGLAMDSKLYNDEKLLSFALWMEKFVGGKYE